MIMTIDLLTQNKIVSNNVLNEIFYKEGINKIHLNREKNKCIEKINLLFHLHTSKKLIFKKRSSFDKRMTEYYLNEKL